MNEDEFFGWIDRARGGTDPGLPSAAPDAMRALLDDAAPETVADFGAEFYRQLIRLNRWSVWGAGYVIAGGMGDDSFHYFRSWLIGKGRDAVEQALRDPDGLGPFIDTEDVDNELLEYVAIELLQERGIDDDPRDRAASDGFADDEPDGDPFDEETAEDSYPRLAAVRAEWDEALSDPESSRPRRRFSLWPWGRRGR